jgi:hypothetical protein
MKPELLSVLVIHDGDLIPADSAGILNTSDLSLCEVPRKNGTNECYIRDWETVLEVLQEETTIKPDLILIDGRFEKDRSAPPLTAR